MRCWAKRLLVAVFVAAATCVGWWFWYSTRDYGAIFLKRRGALVGDSRHGALDTTLFSDTGLTAHARLRAPATEAKVPDVLLAAGLETGANVVDLIGPRDDMVVLAVDYGWVGEFDISTMPKLGRTMWDLRRRSLETVPRLLLSLEFLARQPQVDAERLIVVGVSYGSYFALPAAVLEPRVSRLILVQGGGDLGAVIAANAVRWRAPVPQRVATWIGETVFLPFRPQRWIGRLAPRPVTFIASRTDPEFPVSAVEWIFARAGQPKELVWHDTPHVAPESPAIIAELARVVVEQLGTPAGQIR
jgi:dienelactone hydrolase